MSHSAGKVLTLPENISLDDPTLGTILQQVSLSLARAVFESDGEMALAFAVDQSEIVRWTVGTQLSLDHTRQLRAFHVVVSLLVGFLAPTTIPKWLRGVNAHLGHRRPIDVLLTGRLSEVVAAIENERGGSFA